MPVKLILKNSTVKDKAPLPADIDVGELAVNLNDQSPAIYGKDSAGNIVKLAGSGNVGNDWTRTGTAVSPKTTGDTVQISAGTAALPGLTPVGDPDTGVWSPGADQLAASTNGVERIRIDANGRLLVGTTVGSDPVTVSGSGTQVISVTTTDTTGYNGGIVRCIYTGGGGGTESKVYMQASNGYGAIGTQTSSPLIFQTKFLERVRITQSGETWFKSEVGTGPVRFIIDANEAARVDASSRLLVGRSAGVAGSAAKLQCTTTANLAGVGVYADNTAAKAGGLVAGDIYRKADGTLMIAF